MKVETGSEEFQDLVHLLVESSSIASIGGGIDNTDPYCKGKGANYCMSLIFAIAKCFRVNKLQISAKTMHFSFKTKGFPNNPPAILITLEK